MDQTPRPPNGKPKPELTGEDDVRHEKVARLKKALQDGTYRVSSDEVAKKLIEHMLRPKS